MSIFGRTSSPMFMSYEEYDDENGYDDYYLDTLNQYYEEEKDEALRLLEDYKDRCLFESEGDVHLDDTDFADPDLIEEVWVSIADGISAPEYPADYASKDEEDVCVLINPIYVSTDTGWEVVNELYHQNQYMIKQSDWEVYKSDMQTLIDEYFGGQSGSIKNYMDSFVDHGLYHCIKIFLDGENLYYMVNQTELIDFCSKHEQIMQKYEQPKFDGIFVPEEFLDKKYNSGTYMFRFCKYEEEYL